MRWPFKLSVHSMSFIIAINAAACGPPPPPEISEFRRIYGVEGHFVSVDSMQLAYISDDRTIDAYQALNVWAQNNLEIGSEIDFAAAMHAQQIIDRTNPMSGLIFMNNFRMLGGAEGFIDQTDYAPGRYLGDGIFCFPHSSMRSQSGGSWRIVFSNGSSSVLVATDRRCFGSEVVDGLRQKLNGVTPSANN